MAGALVAGMGLPASGKSTVFSALYNLLKAEGRDASLYLEPEAGEWGEAVTQRDDCGCITALTWFRAQRVPNLFKAAADRSRGGITLVDSFYDKLIHLYFDEPGFDWLMKPDDPYRAAYRAIAALDYVTLPDADCVVTIVVEEQLWKRRIAGRGRDFDRAACVSETYATQAAFLRACSRYCSERGIMHIEFANGYDTAPAAAKALREQLEALGVIR